MKFLRYSLLFTVLAFTALSVNAGVEWKALDVGNLSSAIFNTAVVDIHRTLLNTLQDGGPQAQTIPISMREIYGSALKGMAKLALLRQTVDRVKFGQFQLKIQTLGFS